MHLFGIQTVVSRDLREFELSEAFYGFKIVFR